MGEVNRIRRARFIEESKAVINNNIKLQKEFIDKYVPTDFASLNARLPKAYRYYEGEAAPTHKKNVMQSQNPYKREELIHRTSFGLYVRSKTEVMISEILETAGLEYYYERPLELTDEKGDKKTIYPDFTIVLEKSVLCIGNTKACMVMKNILSMTNAKCNCTTGAEFTNRKI